MADLSQVEKIKLEKLFAMETGYVIHFSNVTFQQFIFNLFKIDIYNPKYELLGTSKAKRLLAFWQLEGNLTVGKVINELLDVWETQKLISGKAIDDNEKRLFEDSKKTARRLLGLKQDDENNIYTTVETFLEKDINIDSFAKLKIDSSVAEILDKRVIEISKNIESKASLSAIIMCGSVLEGLLLGIATSRSKDFNQCICSPKSKVDGKVLQFNDWTLSNFIDAAYELRLIGLDVKKYSHSLRDFRNYIHPYQQMNSRFDPDIDTAKISWQVLKAAVSDLTKNN